MSNSDNHEFSLELQIFPVLWC